MLSHAVLQFFRYLRWSLDVRHALAWGTVLRHLREVWTVGTSEVQAFPYVVCPCGSGTQRQGDLQAAGGQTVWFASHW